MHVPASFDPELIKREIPQNSKAKNHMVITTNTEKVFDKIQHSFMIKKKSLQGMGIESTFVLVAQSCLTLQPHGL